MVYRLLIILLVLSAGAVARAESVAFVVAGNPTTNASRATFRCNAAVAEEEGVDTLRSSALRRALAGLPPSGATEEDPLSDVRAMARAATGENLHENLSRLGRRLDVELLVTLRAIDTEVEVRVFNIERGAFYQGTLMLGSGTNVDAEEVRAFVVPRVRASAAPVGEPSGSDEPSRPSRSRWWIWAGVGAVALGLALLAFLVQPGDAPDDEVRLRIVVP